MQKITVGVIVAFLAGLVVGIGLGRSLEGRQAVGSLQGELERSQRQLERAREFFPTIDEEIFGLAGVVTAVGEGVVTFEVGLPSSPFDEWPTVREAVLSDDTVVIRRRFKDQVVFQQELAAYDEAFTLQEAQAPTEEATALGGTLPSPPDPFKDETITISAIVAGDQIQVEASENIKTAVRFTATRIVIDETALLAEAEAFPEAEEFLETEEGILPGEEEVEIYPVP